MNYPSSINSNVRANKTMFSSNLTLEEIPHRDHKLRNIAKVENCKSTRSGKPIANQFIITLQVMRLRTLKASILVNILTS